MIRVKGLDTLKPAGKYPCSVCRKGVTRNSLFCTSCDAWVHKKCSGIKDRLVYIPDFSWVLAQHAILMLDLLNIFHPEIKD